MCIFGQSCNISIAKGYLKNRWMKPKMLRTIKLKEESRHATYFTDGRKNWMCTCLVCNIFQKEWILFPRVILHNFKVIIILVIIQLSYDSLPQALEFRFSCDIIIKNKTFFLWKSDQSKVFSWYVFLRNRR